MPVGAGGGPVVAPLAGLLAGGQSSAGARGGLARVGTGCPRGILADVDRVTT